MNRSAPPSLTACRLTGRFSRSVGLGMIRGEGYRLLNFAASPPIAYRLNLDDDTLIELRYQTTLYPLTSRQLYDLWYFHDGLIRWLKERTRSEFWLRSIATGLATDPQVVSDADWRDAECHVKRLTLEGDPCHFLASAGPDHGLRKEVYTTDVLPFWRSLRIIP